MDSENKFPFFTIAVSIYLIAGGAISIVNFIYELPYSMWAYNNLPVWLAGTILTMSSLCFIIGVIPPQKRTIVSNLLLAIVFVTTFLFLVPSYRLVPEYMKIYFIVCLLLSVIGKVVLRKNRNAQP
jgi:hypothetical protein